MRDEYVVGWFRKGYRKAEKRYGEGNAYEVMTAFQVVMVEADKVLKYAEEGDKLVVQIDVKNGGAMVTHQSYYENKEE